MAHSGTGATERPWASRTRARLDHAEAAAAVGLGNGQPEQVGLGQLGPQLAVEAVLAGLHLLDPLGGAQPGEQAIGGLLDGPLLLVEGEVHQLFLVSLVAGPSGAGRNTGRVRSSSNSSKSATTGMPMAIVLGGDAAHVGHQPGALFELDQRHHQRVVERRHLGVVVDDEAVDGAPARRGDRVPVEGPAVGTRRAGRVAEGAAVGAALDEQLVLLGPLEEEAVVLGEGGTGPLRAGRRLCRRPRRAVAAFGRGLNLRIRNSMVATGSPCWSVNSRRVVMKWPTPRPVAFSDDTASMTELTSRWSPGTRGRT